MTARDGAADDWFQDHAALEGLAAKSVRSGATAVGARAAQLFVQLGAAMWLARILTPGDFGIQAMVLPVAFLMNGITQQALQSAVMQRDDLRSKDASALFFAALPINLGLTSAMALLGPVLAWLYREPRVIAVAIIWAGVIFLTTLATIHEALLKRQLRFATVARMQLGAHVASFVVAIVAATAGAHYWALLGQVAVMELGRAGGMWLLVSWRPRWSGRRPTAPAAAMRSYWLGVIGARTASWVGDQSDRVTVGALGGASIAGLYDSAKRWAWFAFFELFIPLTDVAVATLSRVRNDAERFRTYVRQALLPIAAVTMPAAAFMFVEARLVLRVILGDQWLGAAVFVRWLCIALVGATVIRLMWWVYLATGRTTRQLRWSLVTTPVTLAAVLVGGLGYGAVGVSAGLAVATLLLAIPSIRNAVHDTPVTLGDCVGVIALPLAAAAIAAGMLMVLDPWLPVAPAVVALALRLAVFVLLYALGWLALPGGRRALIGLFAKLGEVISTWRGALGRRPTR